MARIPEQELDRLKREISVQRLAEAQGVKLKRHGADLIGLCPFHDDKNPSMWVNARWNICRCFKPSCKGAARHLDVINVHAMLRGIGNEYAIQELAAELGL